MISNICSSSSRKGEWHVPVSWWLCQALFMPSQTSDRWHLLGSSISLKHRSAVLHFISKMTAIDPTSRRTLEGFFFWLLADSITKNSSGWGNGRKEGDFVICNVSCLLGCKPVYRDRSTFDFTSWAAIWNQFTPKAEMKRNYHQNSWNTLDRYKIWISFDLNQRSAAMVLESLSWNFKMLQVLGPFVRPQNLSLLAQVSAINRAKTHSCDSGALDPGCILTLQDSLQELETFI